MTRHWLQKYVSCFEYDLELLQVHPAFKSVRMEDWFKALIQNKAH